MYRYCLVLALVLSSSASLGADAEFPSVRNATSIVESVRQGADLRKTGLADLIYEDELAALGELAKCDVALAMPIEKNLAVFDWTCNTGNQTNTGVGSRRQTLEMRFKDDGSLFALAINPTRSELSPTAKAVKLGTLPHREATTKQFALAVVEGRDFRLADTIPLTTLQESQLGRLSGSRWEIQRYMSEKEKEQARRYFGKDDVFFEAPEDALEIVFSPPRKLPMKDRFVTLYFDDSDRPIGLKIEDSLIATTILRLGS